jgi:hypothetical protein
MVQSIGLAEALDREVHVFKVSVRAWPAVGG